MAARRSPIPLLLASHPGPVVAVTAASAAYGAAIGRGPAGTAAVGCAVLAGQLSIGWHNDWLDADRDVAAARTDKPVARGLVDRDTVLAAAFVAAAATVPLSLVSGWRAGCVHCGAVALAWGYNAGLKSTVFSFAPFTAAFGLLPVFVALGAPHAPLGPWWAPLAAALLGTGAHLMNALPDLEADERAGVRGLPHRLGRTRSTVAAALVLLGATCVLAFHSGAPSPLGIAGCALAGAGVVAAVGSARRTTSRAPFGLTIAVALLDVTLLVVAGHGAR